MRGKRVIVVVLAVVLAIAGLWLFRGIGPVGNGDGPMDVWELTINPESGISPGTSINVFLKNEVNESANVYFMLWAKGAEVEFEIRYPEQDGVFYSVTNGFYYKGILIGSWMPMGSYKLTAFDQSNNMLAFVSFEVG